MVYNYFGADGSNWFKYARKSSELTSGTEMEATWTGITLRYNNTSQSHINQIALKEQCSGEGRGRVFIACDMDHVAHMWWTDTPEINSPTVWQRHQLNKASGKREFCKGVKLYEDAQGKVYCGFMNQNGEIVEYPFKSYKIDGDSMTHCKLPEFSWNNELDCTANPITLGDPWTANQAGSNLSLVNDNGVMKIAARDSSSTLGFYKESNNIAKEDTVVMEARLKVVSGSKLPCYLSISDGELAVIARMDVDGGFHLGNVFTPVVDGYDFSSDFAKIRIVKFGQLGGAIWVNDKLALAGFDIFIKSSTNRVSFGVGSGSDTNDEVHFDNVKYATGIKKDYKKVRKPAVQLLYDRGTQNVTWEAGYSEGNSSQSIESNCLKLEVHGNGASTASCTYVTSEQVDVTDVDHILITVTGYDTNHQWGKINAGLLTNKSHSLTASGVQLGVVAQGLESAKVHAVDVRNFSGLYYIGLEARDSSISVNYNGCYEVQSVSLVGVGYYEPVSSLPRYAKGKGFYGYGIENVEWEYREVRGNGGHIHAKATDHLRLALEGGVQEKEIYWTTSDPIDTSKYGWIFAVVEGSRFEEMTGSGCLVMMTTASKDVGWNNSIARIDAEYHRGSTMNGKHVVALDLRQESGLQYLSVGLVDNGSSTANVSDVKISFIGQPEAVDNGWDLMPWVMAGDRQVYQHSKQTIGQGYNITLDQPVTLEKGTQLPITTQLVPSVNGVQGVLQSVDDERLNFKSTVTESTTVDISITGKCVELDAVMYHI